MNEEMQKAVLERIDLLADKLGVAGEHLWGVLVAQAYVDAWAALAFVGVMGLVFSVSLIGLLRLVMRKTPHPHEELLGPIFLGVMIVSGILFAIGLVAGGPTVLTGFINPEYAAFKDVAEILR